MDLPLIPGQVVNYRVQTIYWNYLPSTIALPGVTPPTSTALFLGDMSGQTASTTLIMPPVISWPQSGGSMDGTFQCKKVTGANNYILQISSSPTYATENTVTVQAATSNADPTLEEADYTVAQMLASPQLQSATTVYIRMGANLAGSTNPPVAQMFSYYNGYVFSTSNSYSLSQALAMSRMIRPGLPTMPGQNKSVLGRGAIPGDGHRSNLGRVSPL
jgi:hypothetical protein